MVSVDRCPQDGQVIVEMSCTYRPLYIFSSTGSITLQFAASKTMSEANRSSPRVLRDRCGDPHADPATQIAGRFHHHAPHPKAMAKALIAKSGMRHSATISTPPRTLALAPTAARLSGITQHDEATTAPSPAKSPIIANHFGAAGLVGGSTFGVASRAALLRVMARLSMSIEISCTP